jgi:hypothetical protein
VKSTVVDARRGNYFGGGLIDKLMIRYLWIR